MPDLRLENSRELWLKFPAIICYVIQSCGISRDMNAVKVLIVDDHPIVLSGCRALLAEASDMLMLEARDAATAQEVYAAHSPEVAVIDINLRGQSAFPVADALEARAVPFVFATGYSASTVPDRYRHIPRWEKPYRLEELVQALPALIHRS